jgi:hypothetical protein
LIYALNSFHFFPLHTFTEHSPEYRFHLPGLFIEGLLLGFDFSQGLVHSTARFRYIGLSQPALDGFKSDRVRAVRHATYVAIKDAHPVLAELPELAGLTGAIHRKTRAGEFDRNVVGFAGTTLNLQNGFYRFHLDYFFFESRD